MAENVPDPLVQIVRRGDLEAVVFALQLYMEQDECACETCSVHCEGCMYCIAHTALVAIGYLEAKEADAC